jgi:hypothetical protein
VRLRILDGLLLSVEVTHEEEVEGFDLLESTKLDVLVTLIFRLDGEV